MIMKISLGLVMVCLFAAIASGFGHRFQLWTYGTGFKILAGAIVGAALCLVLAVIGMFLAWRAGSGMTFAGSVVAVVLALVIVIPVLLQVHTARRLPYIHDITTDTENPPAFVAILQERANAPNTATYGGPEIAKLQKQAYPDIQPLELSARAADVFVTVLETVNELGWAIVESDPASGRVEASDRTFWYGFVDDIVIRVKTLPTGKVRVDVRSVSRVGKSDIGANARRIRNFMEHLARRIPDNVARE